MYYIAVSRKLFGAEHYLIGKIPRALLNNLCVAAYVSSLAVMSKILQHLKISLLFTSCVSIPDRVGLKSRPALVFCGDCALTHGYLMY